MRLHVWGPVSTSLSFSAPCLATTWYMQLCNLDFTVVQSSNEGLAGELPCLETGEKKIGGAEPIIRYLKSLGHDLDADLSTEEQIKNTALLSYMSLLQTITEYSLFVDEQTYQKVSRPMFNSFMPFLMQYNVSVRLREQAKDRCCAAGIDTATPSWAVSATKMASESLTNPKPNMGKLYDQSVEREKQKDVSQAVSKTVFRLLNAATEAYTDIKDSATADVASGRLFSSVSTSDVFLAAHLQLQTLPVLPDCAVAGLLKSKFPELLQYKDVFVEQLGELKVEGPLGKDAPVWIFHLKQILGWY
ncbi:hypothetical protein CJU90_3902 [Yarrowia sp. C11]|nr:hypothetical protein CKK34_5514 [Yarrowia sp. E02]KAG5367602.1 hypothetical protein CJU90_3902 [Yarrowia sp. C11]